MFQLNSDEMARRVAEDIPDGAFVNLGIGLPTKVSNYVTGNKQVIYHSENGVLGVGPAPRAGEENINLINASKQFVTLLPGGSYFDSADSFAMMRGGHIDIAVLGAFQVAENGDLANWATNDETFPPAVGGAMDLAVGAKQLFIVMRHTGRNGEPKLLKKCTYPLTGRGVVSRIYTDLAVLEVTPQGFRVVELFGDNTLDQVQALSEATLLPPLST